MEMLLGAEAWEQKLQLVPLTTPDVDYFKQVINSSFPLNVPSYENRLFMLAIQFLSRSFFFFLVICI